VPDAHRALDRALMLDPNDARAYSLRAVIELVQNRKADARADAERAVAADPAAPEAHLALSWVQQAEFDLDGALTSARRAVELSRKPSRSRKRPGNGRHKTRSSMPLGAFCNWPAIGTAKR
jgi:Tfp pilus assembly protein PilF